MDVTPSGMMMEVKPEQPEKASSPMVFTELGMVTVTEVKPEQPEKAEPPILVTSSGMVMDVNPEQP